LNTYLQNKQILNQNTNEKIRRIDIIYSEFKSKIDEIYFYKYSEIFYSFKELKNINLVKLIKNKEFSEKFVYQKLYRNENWTKVKIIKYFNCKN
jgi:hypothetical protein